MTRCITIGDHAHTIREWAALTGIGYQTIRLRLLKGWPVERVLAPVRQPERITFRGKSLTYREWAALTGLSVSLIYGRVAICGWPVERALTEPVNGWAPRSAAPGVVRNLVDLEGTGAQSTTQDLPEIEFLE